MLIDIPKDITVAECEYKAQEPEKYIPYIRCFDRDIKKAAEVIDKAEKPMILAGGGIIAAKAEKEHHEGDGTDFQ